VRQDLVGSPGGQDCESGELPGIANRLPERARHVLLCESKPPPEDEYRLRQPERREHPTAAVPGECREIENPSYAAGLEMPVPRSGKA